MTGRNVMNPMRAAKVAAKRLGISADEYLERRASGEKWCWACREWHRLDAFGGDRTRRDGFSNICRAAIRLRYPQTAYRSLTATIGEFGSGAFVDDLADKTTLINYEELDAAERLHAIVGDMEPEDVRLLNSETLERLRDRLRAEGLVPYGATKAERERLKDPDRHSGGNIAQSKSRAGRRRRKEQVALMSGKRSSRKQPKRWSREKVSE